MCQLLNAINIDASSETLKVKINLIRDDKVSKAIVWSQDWFETAINKSYYNF